MGEAATSDPGSVAVAELLSRADAGEPLLLLDVRNDEEFDAWRLEGRRPIETVHIPYFDFIEDPAACVGRLPRNRDIVAVCAQGGSSVMVVDALREAGIAAQSLIGGMVAYGEYLQPVRVPLDDTDAATWEMWQVNRRGKGCLSYVIRSGREAIVVDPSRDVSWYEEFARGLGADIVRVLDTHVHADHVSGGPTLATRVRAPYFVKAGEGFELRHAIEPLGDGQKLRVGGDGGVTLDVRIMATPGHTPGSSAYLVGRRHLLTGDTLFVNGVGRPDLGGHVVEWGRALFRTLRERLATLPDDAVVLPAHYAGPGEISAGGVVAALLGVLRHTVPELQIPDEEAFVEAMRKAVKPAPATYDDVIRVNLGLAEADPEKATEWELGKNQCAAGAAHAIP
jgi:glyoxylase-like metal-dependent hydrolase (beta-lactamase superfamily II)/rhodanese-related sulfurtransferase